MTTVKNKLFYLAKILGIVLVLYSGLILILNQVWLKTGDVFRPSFRFFMRGGWYGFEMSTVWALFGLVGGIILLWLSFASCFGKNKKK